MLDNWLFFMQKCEINEQHHVKQCGKIGKRLSAAYTANTVRKFWVVLYFSFFICKKADFSPTPTEALLRRNTDISKFMTK